MAGLVPEVLERLIAELEKLPGIGRRSAERVAFHLLRTSNDEAFKLAEAIRDLKLKLRHCSVCYNLTDDDPCRICRDERRDKSLVCVIEQPKDLTVIENTGMYNGVYHVLMGRVAPLDGVAAADLTIDPLIQRIEAGTVREIILATNPTLEGDGTAMHLVAKLKDYPIKVTRLARGLAVGGQLEFTSKATIADALDGRKEF